MVIVGGGITGLAAALIASKSGAKVTVLEASDEPGGLLKTFEIGQNRLEHFYHHFFNHDAELHWLISHLGLEEKVIYKNTRMGVFREGKIFDFTTPRDLLSYTPMNWLDKLRFVISSWYLGNWAKWQKNEHISAYRWLARWSGKSTFEALWKPLLDVKFGSLAHSVPLAWMIGRLRQRFHSRRAGQEQLGYMHGSLQVLLDALIGRLKDSGVNLIVNAKVDQVTVSNNCLLNVIANESFIDGDKFLFTIPGNYVGDMLRPTHSSLSHRLNEVKYFNAVCVILELNKALTDKYWLNIADPGYAFGGVIEQTNFVDPIQYNGSHIVYLSRYFSDEEAIANMSNDEIAKLMIGKLQDLNHNFSEDWIRSVRTFRSSTAATICDSMFSKKVPSCKTEISNMFVANMSHIYPDERSANNSIRVAAEACRCMGYDSKYIPSNQSLSGKIGF